MKEEYYFDIADASDIINLYKTTYHTMPMPINQVITINYIALRPDTWQPRFKITTIGGTVNIVWEDFSKYFELVK